jgi:hypothetical protein
MVNKITCLLMFICLFQGCCKDQRRIYFLNSKAPSTCVLVDDISEAVQNNIEQAMRERFFRENHFSYIEIEGPFKCEGRILAFYKFMPAHVGAHGIISISEIDFSVEIEAGM